MKWNEKKEKENVAHTSSETMAVGPNAWSSYPLQLDSYLYIWYLFRTTNFDMK